MLIIQALEERKLSPGGWEKYGTAAITAPS